MPAHKHIAFVVHGEGGLDEISTAGATLVCEVRGGTVRQFELLPEDAGIARAPLEGLRGGDVRQNAEMLRGVLRGESGPRRACAVGWRGPPSSTTDDSTIDDGLDVLITAPR